MVKTVTKDGFFFFLKIGGIDDRILPAQRVVVHTKKGAYKGVIGSKPPHIQKDEERRKVLAFDDLFIDVGAESKEVAVEKLGVSIGDSVVFDVDYVALNDNMVMGKAFDNRAGCLAMVETLKLLSDADCTVCVVGTVQEEVGLRGAGVAAFGVDPDVALALDVTIAGDVPGVREYDTSVKTGKGPALSISDSGLITHPKVLRWLLDTVEEEKVAIQLESGLMGSTDAARISLTRQGIPSGTISIPTRYIHSPAAMLNIQDIENSAKLAAAAIKRISKYF
jgi:endoglucanase